MRLSNKALDELARHELIGLNCRVIGSSQKSLVGVEGRIVDETLNMLIVETSTGEKRLQKESVTLEIEFPEGKFVISGKDIMQRPYERLKKIWRKIR
ncbi:MAG: ribonuclease P protein subunit [Candidatus Diapherotrites archaeon]|nr:ribonuclease P protein subunit [Candidatus Diapherotrites archaeon]